ncbi:MAG: protein kinase [Chloroflexi bacterium]|nr:protein kinase [Chloroflexota bacterium]
MDTFVNRELKGYEIREQIGVGGFGVVYRALQSAVGREVAIKIILPQFANQAEFVRRFEVEAQVIARLEHPHIVPLYDYWRDPQGAYLVMRWLPGSLRTAIERGPWTLEAVAHLLDQIASALTVAHREGIVHRDIKPDNILLDEDENAYLADFGIAKDVNLRGNGYTTGQYTLSGSPAYISPEQIRSQEVSARSDLYSLGYVLYELLTGHKPFPDASTPSDYIMRHLSDPLPMMSIQHTHIPAAVDEVLQTATAKDPAARYASALRFAAALRAALPSRLPRLPAQPLPEQLTERELEVLRLMIEGLGNHEIAQRLFLTPGTVKWYIKQVYGKLDAHSRQQAIERALSLKLTEPRVFLLNDQGDQIEAGTPLEKPVMLVEPENPYKGLRAFYENDTPDFFGRAALTERLLNRLSEGNDGLRFLALVGPSGSGKSSLVRAGLIPALRAGALSVSPNPFIVTLMPGTHPLEELEAALLSVAVNPMPGLLEQLREDRRGLVRAVKRLLPNDSSTELILVIDQFEELFSLVNDETLRVHFIDNLLAAANDPRGRVRLILTLRADFYDRPLMYPRLAELVRTNTEVITPLAAREMEQAIVAPLERMGMHPEAGLVSTIIQDVGEQPGTLPLLQHTLTELFERREGLTLTLDAYKAMGGVMEALAQRAEDIYTKLSAPLQRLTKQIFLRLVTLGEGTEDTRRRVLLAECHALGSESAVEDILNAFAKYRLLTLDRDPLTRGPTVEIAHEALIREWGRLRTWLKESREEIRLQRQLHTLAQEWQDAVQDDSFLLRGSRLEIFEKWVSETPLMLTEREHKYLQASSAAYTRQRYLEQEQQARELRLARDAAESQKRAANRLGWLALVLLLAVLGAFALLGVALNQGTEAQNARSTSDANFLEAQELALVNGAQLALANDNGDLARALAVEANRAQYPSGQAQAMLAQAVYTPGTVRVFREHISLISAVSLSSDGQRALSTSVSGGYVWDVASGRIIHTLLIPDTEMSGWGGAYSPDDRYLAAGTGITVTLYDAETGAALRILRGHNDLIVNMVFSPDSALLATASWDGTAMLWDVQTGVALRTLSGHDSQVIGVAFSPDGAHIVSVSRDRTAILWQVASGAILHRFNEDFAVHTDALFGAAYSPDGRVIATTSADGTLALWDAQQYDLIRQTTVESRPFAVVFSHNGRILLTPLASGLLMVWDTATLTPTARLAGHASEARSVAISRDDRYALTTSQDRTVRVWDLRYGAEVAPTVQHDGGIQWIALSPDGRYMLASTTTGVSGSLQSVLTLYDAASGAEIRRFGADGVAYRNVVVYALDVPYLPVAFSPDGQQILTAALTDNPDYPTRHLDLWDVASGAFIREYSVTTTDPTEAINALGFSSDGRHLLVNTYQAMIYDANSGELLRVFGWENGGRRAIFSVDGRTVLYGENRGTISLWDVESGQLIRRFGVDGTHHGTRVRALAHSHDGRLAATGSDDGRVVLWDVERGVQIHRLVAHQGAV